MRADQWGTAWRSWAVWGVLVVVLACLALWFAPIWMGHPRPTTVGGWVRGVLGLTVLIVAWQWIVGLRERTMRREPMPSVLPASRASDRDRAT